MTRREAIEELLTRLQDPAATRPPLQWFVDRAAVIQSMETTPVRIEAAKAARRIEGEVLADKLRRIEEDAATPEEAIAKLELVAAGEPLPDGLAAEATAAEATEAVKAEEPQ